MLPALDYKKSMRKVLIFIVFFYGFLSSTRDPLCPLYFKVN
jgi:hypothetical protein